MFLQFSPNGNRIDLRRRDMRDAIIVMSLAATVFVGTATFAVFTLGPTATVQHGPELPTITAVLLICCVLALFFGHRRMQDLRNELAARERAEARATACTKSDFVTGLPNSRCFADQTAQALRKAEADRGRVALLLLDLDHFKPTLHLHGDATADAVLVELAQRLKPALPDKAVLARVGDDDFAVLLTGVESFDTPTRLARRLTVIAAEPIQVNGRRLKLGASMGIALSPEDGVTADDLLRRAKVALAQAKTEGPSSVRFFAPEMDAAISQGAQLVDELRVAIAQNAITPHYQPIVNLTSGRVLAFEALARWTSPTLGDVSPARFIEAAEDAGLIEDLSMQLLRRACRDAMAWPPEIKLSFNISPLQLNSPAFGLRVLSLLGETGLPPSRLQLEITEAKVVENTASAHSVLSELAAAGVCVALDDYGTANATLAQLLSLPFHRIKIDRSIVARIGSNTGDTVLRSLVGVSGGLSMHLTAEGIETAEQVEKLLSIGCSEGQGFFFGRPVPAAQTSALIRQATERSRQREARSVNAA